MEQDLSGLPALTLGQPSPAFSIKSPEYLIENWRQHLAITSPNQYSPARVRYIRVFGGIATVGSENLMMRLRLNLPDGHYLMGQGNVVTRERDCDRDVQPVPVQRMIASEEIRREDIHQLMNWVQECRRRDPKGAGAAHIVIDARGFHYERDASFSWRIPSQVNPGAAVVLPVKSEPIMVEGFHLKLALCEATRYDTVVIAHEDSLDAINPLFIGKSWEQCCLIVPKPMYLDHKRTHG